jgi:hypothetical protein
MILRNDKEDETLNDPASHFQCLWCGDDHARCGCPEHNGIVEEIQAKRERITEVQQAELDEATKAGKPIVVTGAKDKPLFNDTRYKKDLEDGVEFEYIVCPHIKRDANGYPADGQECGMSRGHFPGTDKQVITITCHSCWLDVQSKGEVER